MPHLPVEVDKLKAARAPEAAKMAITTQAPNMTPGQAALLGLMRRYLAAVMDP